MPRYSPEDIKRSNRTLLYILILLVGIIVAFIVAIATSSNDATIIVTQEVNNLKRLQAQQELEDTSQVGNSQDSINNAEVVKKEVKPENEPVAIVKQEKVEENTNRIC
jgi:predicted PurR-regulated permease PerM